MPRTYFLKRANSNRIGQNGKVTGELTPYFSVKDELSVQD